MKLLEKEHNVESTLDNTKSFSMHLTSHTFNMFSDSLYTDSITAVIRELTCNAIDSHIEAGCPERPIDVTLPSEMNPFFIVQDFGVGMDEEQIDNIYTSYANSTKNSDNSQVGGFGIGSKSPFAYVDSFTVVTIKDGIKLTYITSRSTTGIPQHSKVGEILTDEPNGVTISVPVQTHDIDRFVTKSVEVFRYYDVHPNVKGNKSFVPESLEYTHNIDKFYFVDKQWNSGSIYVIQGGVKYTVNTSKLIEEGADLYKLTRLLKAVRSDLYVKYPIGTVMMATSREELKYDEPTLEILTKDLNSLVDTVSKKVQAAIDKCETYWEACQLNKRNSQVQLDVFDNNNPTSVNFNEFSEKINWRGRKLDDHISFSMKRDRGIETCRYTLNSGYCNKIATPGVVLKSDDGGIVLTRHKVPVYGKHVIINDLKTRFVPRIEKFMEENSLRNIHCLRWPVDTQVSDDEIKVISRMLGGVEVVRLSDIEAPKRVNHNTYTTPVSLFWDTSWDNDMVPINVDEDEEPGYFVEVKRNQPVNYDSKNIKMYVALVKRHTGKRVLCVKSADVKRAKKKGWKEISFLLTGIANKYLPVLVYRHLLTNNLDSTYRKIFSVELDQLFLDAKVALYRADKKAKFNNWSSYNDFIHQWASKGKLKSWLKKPAIDFIEEVNRKYPMLDLAMRRYMGVEELEKCKNYVKLVNSTTNQTEG